MNERLETKFFEIRDRGTSIPAIGIKMISPHKKENYLLKRSGYSRDHVCILLTMIETCRCAYDPYDWVDGSRTMTVAHDYIEKKFDEIETGAVVDVQFILGETKEPKKTEMNEHIQVYYE
jgi:hypothetical protein